MKSAIFRVDARAEIGLGHLMRSATLAQALAECGWKCRFICSSEGNLAESLLKRLNLPMLTIQSPVSQLSFSEPVVESETADAQQCLRAIDTDTVDLIVVDHYQLSANWESILRSRTHLITVIDDLANREHDCDLLVDVTQGRQAEDYRALVPSGAELCVGASFAFIRSEFVHRRGAAELKRGQLRGVKRLVVGFGGTDPQKLTLQTLKALQACQRSVQVDVLITRGCAWLDELSAECQAMNNVTLHIDSEDVAELTLAADFGIGSASSMAWERCVLGLPSVAVICAENQRAVGQALSAAKAAVVISPEALVATLQQWLTVPTEAQTTRLQQMSAACFHLVDGRGVERVRDAVNLRYLDTLVLKPADDSHALILFNWQCDPLTRKYFRNSEAPEWAEHLAWLRTTLQDPDRSLWLAYQRNEPVGYLRLDHDAVKQVDEVSIFVKSAAQQKGIASWLLEQAKLRTRMSALYAEVAPENTASHQLFRKCGFVLSGQRDYYWRVTSAEGAI